MSKPNNPREKELSNEIYASRDDIKGLARLFRSSKDQILGSPLLKSQMNKAISKFNNSESEIILDYYEEIYDEINDVSHIPLRTGAKSELRDENKAIVINENDNDMLPNSQKRALQYAKEQTNAGKIIDCLTHGIDQLTTSNKEIKASDLIAASQAASAINNTVDTILKVSEFLDKKNKAS
ncbi:MAG: hypothetical protein GY909_15645 [Oligoflexia bacterium]|nr:hypothetical protein [Oligoflexia bacterium]